MTVETLPRFEVGQGDTQFPVEGTLEDSDGQVVDLSSADEIKFQMAPIAGGDLTVDADAVLVTDGTDGEVRYVWQAGETDVAGFYLAKWLVIWNDPDDKQSFPNDGYIIVHITPDLGVVIPAVYCQPEEVKKMLTLSNTTFADGEILPAVLAASQGVNDICGRDFHLAASTDTSMFYRPSTATSIVVDDLVSVTSLFTDQDSDGEFEREWDLDTEFFLWPLNAAARGRPYTQITLNSYRASVGFPFWAPRSVKVTGKFGWPALPAFLPTATRILASRLIKRMREAPFGIVTVGLDVGSAVRIGRSDPEIMGLCENYTRERVV